MVQVLIFGGAVVLGAWLYWRWTKVGDKIVEDAKTEVNKIADKVSKSKKK